MLSVRIRLVCIVGSHVLVAFLSRVDHLNCPIGHNNTIDCHVIAIHRILDFVGLIFCVKPYLLVCSISNENMKYALVSESFPVVTC